jgi:hypothetical protein
MSRGHGAVQREVLDLLHAHACQHVKIERELDTWVSVFKLAEEMTPADQEFLTPAPVGSIRRAVKTPAAQREIDAELMTVRRNGKHKRMLTAGSSRSSAIRSSLMSRLYDEILRTSDLQPTADR